MSNYEVMGNLKVLNDYSENGKPNWYAIINDADDKEHRAYVNQDLASLNREISDPNAIVLVEVKGETGISKSGKNAGQPYIKNAKIKRMGDDEAKPSVPTSSETKTKEMMMSRSKTREELEIELLEMLAQTDRLKDLSERLEKTQEKNEE